MALVSAFAVSGVVLAKPFNPVFRSVRQADGSSLQVKTVGDEHFHYLITADGHLVADSLGSCYYLNAAGRNSGILAHASDVQTAQEVDFLSPLNADSVLAAYFANVGYRTFGQPKTSGSSLRSLSSLSKPSISTLCSGTHNILVVMVNTSEKTFTTTSTDWSNQFNLVGYSVNGNYGSVHDYFYAQSRGKLNLNFDVYGPVTVTGTLSSLSDEDILKQALTQISLKSGVDYDGDDDNYYDCVIILTAGNSDNNGGHGTYQGFNYNYQYQGLTVGKYVMAPECGNGTYMDAAGSVIHEFGHVLGLPDLYTLGTTDQRSPKYWDVMDYGCYNGSDSEGHYYGTQVPNYSGFELMSMGWEDPVELNADSIGQYSLPPLQQNKYYLVPSSNNGEYFFVENRQQQDWDAMLPGHGMLVWHVNYTQKVWDDNSVNNTSTLNCYVMEAKINSTDYFSDLDYYSFPGTAKVTSFSGFTDYSNKTVDLTLSNITEQDGYICFSTDGSAITACPCQTSVDTTTTDTTTSDTTSTDTTVNKYTQAATLTKHGVGRSSQSEAQNADISSFYFVWSNADSVVVSGLPDGVVATLNFEDSTVTFTGSATDSVGTYNYTVTTVGGLENVSKSGTFTITASTGLSEQSADAVVAVFPNPVQAGQPLYLIAPSLLQVNWTLQSLTGTTVAMGSATGNDASAVMLTSTALPAGIYVLTLQTLGNERHFKLGIR